MFCTNCGASITAYDRFCAKCGAVINSTLAPASTRAKTTTLPFFGAPVAKCWGPFKAKNTYPSGYEWVSHRNTLLICKDHLVLLNGDEKRSGALDIISGMGLLGGIVDAVRATKDAIVNSKFDLTPTAAEAIFEKKQMIWCKKSDAEIWRYERKPWMFIKSKSDQLYCKFNSMAGTIHCCLVINSIDDTTADYQMKNEAMFQQTFKGIDLDNQFKIVLVERNVPEKEVRKVMEDSMQKRLPE